MDKIQLFLSKDTINSVILDVFTYLLESINLNTFPAVTVWLALEATTYIRIIERAKELF